MRMLYCRLNFQASEGSFDAKIAEKRFKMIHSDTQTDLLMFFSIRPAAGLPWRTLNRKFRRVLIFEIIVFFPFFAENISSSFYQKHWRYFLNHLCSVFVAFFYVFGIPVSFSSYYFARFSLFETKTNSTNAKLVNFYTVFTSTTIDSIALFLSSIPSCFLIHFVF